MRFILLSLLLLVSCGMEDAVPQPVIPQPFYAFIYQEVDTETYWILTESGFFNTCTFIRPETMGGLNNNRCHGRYQLNEQVTPATLKISYIHGGCTQYELIEMGDDLVEARAPEGSIMLLRRCLRSDVKEGPY